ncbi:MAG: AmmeMemoRadiSam system protein B [SAR324 cluster bacterium]|nr:AmmeMemoRadiSam system protein B [SAR324 cluster bacterium]
MSQKTTRPPAVSGTFYPSDPEQLRADIQGYLSGQKAETKRKPKFLIVPHAGYYYSGEVAAAAFIEVAGYSYDQIFLLGPSHHYSFSGALLDGADFWETPLGKVEIRSAKLLNAKSLGFAQNQAYHAPEHSLEVQIPFIQEVLPEAPITPILLSGGMGVARAIATELEGLKGDNLIVVSTDFNHAGPRFGYEPEKEGWGTGTQLDEQACRIIEGGDTGEFRDFNLKYQCTICGNLPVLTAMLLAKSKGLENFKLKTYSNSAAKTGGPDSVGYAALYL